MQVGKFKMGSFRIWISVDAHSCIRLHVAHGNGGRLPLPSLSAALLAPPPSCCSSLCLTLSSPRCTQAGRLLELIWALVLRIASATVTSEKLGRSDALAYAALRDPARRSREGTAPARSNF